MLEVESTRQVRRSRKKRERSQSAGLPVKSDSSEINKTTPTKEKVKLGKVLLDSQDKLSSISHGTHLLQREMSGNTDKARRKKHRKRTQSADELNHDTTTIAKDHTAAEESVVRANLYTNDKNRSLEKETKQSYSEALSGWQHSVETGEERLREPKKTGNERGERRVKKKKNIADAEMAVIAETAVSTEKARRRLKKKPKDENTEVVGVDAADGQEGISGTHRDIGDKDEDRVARENLGFDNDEGAVKATRRRDGKAKKKSRARENLGYEEEEDRVKEAVTPEPETGKKTGKRRRKRLKETSADLIHRALEKKRQDDGSVLCVVVHKADRLKTDLRINHPLVRVHLLDIDTGQYVKKCSRNRAATSYYENQETVDHILPLMTQPFDFKQRKSLVPSWEDVLIINEIYSYFLQRHEGDPKVIIFFEVLDFLSMTAINKVKSSHRPDRGWYQIAWAFLKLVGSNGFPNTDTKIRLQLFYPQRSYRRRPASVPGVPEVYHWWSSCPRHPYPSTLYVTVKGIKPPKHLGATGRSLFAVQEEKGKMTFEELIGKISRGGVSTSEGGDKTNTVAWAKLPGQSNRIPNQVMCTLQAGRRGCFVAKFSNDGRKLACGCADKDTFSIFVFETLSSRCCGRFQGHFSIIYDLCWSQDDKELLSASSDGTARSWDVLSEGSAAVKAYPHPCFVYAARYHPQRRSLVITGGYDRLIRIWSKDSDGVNGQLLREMGGHDGFINTICFDPSGHFMFSGDSSGTILLWNTFENLKTKSRKKKTLTTGDVHGWVITKTVKDPEIKGCIINSIHLHPNGRKLLVHTRDSVARMVDLRSFNVMNRYIGSNNLKEHVRSTLSTCGSFVFSGSEDGQARVWNTETGELLKVYSELGYRAAVSDVDFHPHDNIVAFCSFGENHPVILYHFNKAGLKEDTTFAQPSPPASPLHSTARTLGQATDYTSTQEPRTLDRTTPRMADVASETLLLNRIKKKLDSVLEVSSTTADLRTDVTSSRALSPVRGATSPYPLPSDTFQRGNVSLSTWGSDFSAWPTGRETGMLTSSRPSSWGAPLDDSFIVKALYPFTARSADELTLEIDDVITVLRQVDEHWWIGEMEDGKQGYFPASYTALLDGKQKQQKRLEKATSSKDKKQYTAVRTSRGEVKILSAPEDNDSDVMFTQRSRVDDRPPRHHRHSRDVTDGTRSLSSPVKKKSPRRTREESIA